jgi:glutathione S-transferase
MSSIAMSALRARGALFAGAKISSRANKVGTTGPRAAVPRVTAAASGDDEYAAQLSRALRTINTASVPVKTVKTAAPVAEAKRAAATEATSVGTADEIVYTLKGPEPQKFGVADGELTNVLTASGSFVTRAVSGALCEGWTPTVVEGSPPEGQYTLGELGGRWLKETSDVAKFPRPAAPIKLYEFEGCPFCRKVREAVVWLDLDVEFYPCPQGGPNFREYVKNTGGKSMFPYMVDDNSGVSMYESDDIIDYLYDKYGPGKEKVPSLLRAGALTVLTAGFGLAPRMGAGSRYTPAKMPEKPITIYSYEASPFCKLVREKLVELELPHLMRTVGRGSPKRQELKDRRGTFQAPYMEDPNTGTAMFESSAIVKYLEEQYAA